MKHLSAIIIALIAGAAIVTSAYLFSVFIQPSLPAGANFNLLVFVSAVVGVITFLGGVISALNDLLDLRNKLITEREVRKRAAMVAADDEGKKIPLPENAVKLPGAEYAGLSISIQAGIGWWWGGAIISQQLDRTATEQFLDAQLLSADYHAPLYTLETGSLGLWNVILTGKSTGEPVQVSNRVPIKVLSFQPIQEVMDIYWYPLAGPADSWLMTTEISQRSIRNPGQISWATFPQDRLQWLREHHSGGAGGDSSGSWPTEIHKALKSGEAQAPDYFLLQNNERIVLTVACLLRDPGIYQLQFGVEYFYQGNLAIAWTDPPLEVYVLHDYYAWIPPSFPPWQEKHLRVSLDRISILHPRTHSRYQYLPVGHSAHYGRLSSNIAFSPDGKLLAAGRFDGSVCLWDVAKKAQRSSFRGDNISSVSSLAFSPDGKILAAASEIVELWNYRKGKKLRTIEGNGMGVRSVSFSPDGALLATAGDAVRLWEVTSGLEVRTLGEEEGWVISISFSSDGKWLASGYQENLVILWNTDTYQEIRRYDESLSALNEISLSPDGQKLAIASDNGVFLWHVQNSEVQRLSSDIVGKQRSKTVAFSPDGDTIAAEIEGTFVVWDAATGEKIHALKSSKGITSIAFSLNGEKLVKDADDTLVIINSNYWDQRVGFIKPD